MTDLSAEWTPTQAEFDLFARVSGDDNPIHLDPGFAAGTTFGRTVSHGMLIYAKLWGLLREADPDARVAVQRLMFPNPAYAGEPLLLSVQSGAGGQLTMSARRLADGAEVLSGEAGLT